MPDYIIKSDAKQTSTLGKVKVMVEQVVGAPSQEAINTAVADYIESHPGSLSPLCAATKAALLQIAEKVAYIDEHGEDYYDALDAALNAKALLQITAVYTQSGTVYDTDSLDSLKADLVVTAYYDDGTTSNVTNSTTLSGELTVGTNTITATYEGMTATFTVTAVSIDSKPLPSGYTQYDYIGSSKKNLAYAGKIVLRQYENLDGFSYDIMLCLLSSIEKGVAIWGSRATSDYLTSYAMYMSSNDANHFRTIAHNRYMLYDTAITKGTPFRVRFNNPQTSPATLQMNDGTVQSYEWTDSRITPSPIQLFCNALDRTTSYNVPYIQIGRMKFMDENMKTVGLYIPCVNSLNRIGMYDLVTDTFCTSSTASYTTVGDSSCPYTVGNWS